MVSLKNPLQDPLQQVASSNTTIMSSKLIFCTKIDLFIQHLLEIIQQETFVVVVQVILKEETGVCCQQEEV